jgi:transketolase
VVKSSEKLQNQAINTIRFLSADAIQKANSGHPGLPMGTAALAYTIWSRHLRFNPQNPNWVNRDRFILSGGHGSMLLYSLLHLTGFDLSLDEIKEFRQWGSRTPGHPEYGLTPGVENTTGPLGQGFSNGIGMAIAEAYLSDRFNRGRYRLIDHHIFGIVTDGDLMEGITSEAASLAGHLKLGKIIYCYDDNRISIDGSTDITFTEDRGMRFEAYGWYVLKVDDPHDVDTMDTAIKKAKADPRPTLIVVKTEIGYGLPTKAGTAKAHGEPPGEVELKGAKENLDWPLEPSFYIPEEVRDHFYNFGIQGVQLEKEWENIFVEYQKEYPQLAVELERILSGKLPKNWDDGLIEFPVNEKGMATRTASGKTINIIAPKLPDLIGGSADLAPSTKTWIDSSPAFQSSTPEGRNFHFGVREHAMGAIINGMSLYPGIIPYGATFLVFSDYNRPAIRLAALSKYPSIWIFTHDSIGVGEDGPTHQPVEHIAALRTIPNLVIIRPGDANETLEAWRVAITHRSGPTAILLTRQSVPTLDRKVYSPTSGLQKGAYVLADLGEGNPEMIIMASGSEVSLIVDAGEKLVDQGKNVRLISFPSWELFEIQDQAYKDSVLPPEITARLAVEAGVAQGWKRWVGDRGKVISIEKFGASAPVAKLFEEYGFTVENVFEQALSLVR